MAWVVYMATVTESEPHCGVINFDLNCGTSGNKLNVGPGSVHNNTFIFANWASEKKNKAQELWRSTFSFCVLLCSASPPLSPSTSVNGHCTKLLDTGDFQVVRSRLMHASGSHFWKSQA